MWDGMGQLGPTGDPAIEDYPQIYPREIFGGVAPREPILRSGDIVYMAPVSTLPGVPTRGPSIPSILPGVAPVTPVVPVPIPPGPIAPSAQPGTGLVNALGASISLGGLHIPVWLILGVGAYFLL